MNLELQYLGRSEVKRTGASAEVRFAPNLRRHRMFFDGQLKDPLRFREAISALHDVVVSDLRFVKKDRTAYKEWIAEQEREEAALRDKVYEDKHAEALSTEPEEVPKDLEKQFRKMHTLYWRARRQWANELRRDDPALFRALVPCDPVVTAAPDSVFFECFSKDESSYGCLLVDNDAFLAAPGGAYGTTNVDYSMSLYEHFQTLRTYRGTRLLVDPSGFEVKVEGRAECREEKIDLPSSWLRGFGQLQAAMALASRTVSLPVEAVYSILAWLKRHREKAGPRCLRFVLVPGRSPTVIIDPWNVVIDTKGPPWQGERQEEIKVWGRRRLFALARVLPITERVDVQLVGSGMPSFWTARMGAMRFVLALSGWTTNDWTGSAALHMLGGSEEVDARLTAQLARILDEKRAEKLDALVSSTSARREWVLASLHVLAKQGQVMFDFSSQLYRWRPLMPVALSEAVIGPEPEEIVGGRQLHARGKLKVLRDEAVDAVRRFYQVDAEGTPCEAIIDGDGALTKARCTCKFHHRNGLKAGPCRHLLALRLSADTARSPAGPTAHGKKEWIH